LLRFLRARTPDSADFGTPPWPPLAEPATPVPMPDLAKPVPETPKPATAKPDATTWVDPVGRICPPTHPVKAKLSSGIFHVPGGLNYERTNPERCYVDGSAAEADGLRPSKR
jgi:micrococcal nuclease